MANYEDKTIQVAYWNGQVMFLLAHPLSVINGITTELQDIRTVRLSDFKELKLDEVN